MRTRRSINHFAPGGHPRCLHRFLVLAGPHPRASTRLPVQSSFRHRVVAGRAQRVAAHQTSDGQPSASDDSVGPNGPGSVVGARRQKPARAPEIGRDKQLVASQEAQSHAGADRQINAAIGGDVRGCGGNRLQGQSGRRRAFRASAPRRRRSPARACCVGKSRVSVAWRDFVRRPLLISE
jgi:hypothetical protein